MKPQKIKETLLKACQDYVQDRKNKVHAAIASIEESLFEEGKSTAGDKHHTGRAMLQIDRENAGKQLQEVEKLVAMVAKIEVGKPTNAVSLGSLVKTEKAYYFMGISAGGITIGDDIYYCVSFSSPIGALLLGKSENDAFSFNGISHRIVALH